MCEVIGGGVFMREAYVILVPATPLSLSSALFSFSSLSLSLSLSLLPSALASPLTIPIFAHARPPHAEAFLDPPPLKTGLTPSSPVGTHSSTPQSVLAGHVDPLLPGGVSASSRIPTSGVGGG